VCGVGCADCCPDCTVRTPSPAGGRAEFVVPAPVRGSVGAGTGTVSSAGVVGVPEVGCGAGAEGADCGACWAGGACGVGWGDGG
jgi:hypothetical protein